MYPRPGMCLSLSENALEKGENKCYVNLISSSTPG